jgi:serine/threonine-protein kinase
MKGRGPYATLLAGVVLAAVVGVADVRANSGEASATAPTPSASNGVSQPTGSETPSESAAPSESASPVDVPARANYAGRTKGRTATVAIAVRDGRAIAYVCDGVRAEAWLLGDAIDGKLTLASEAGDRLTARLGDGKATGRVVLGKQKWTFTVPTVRAPNGLYRANATVGGVRFRGGWIVLPDGQTGVATGTGKPGPAPPIDPAAGAVTIDGTQVPVAPVSAAEDWL